MGKGRAKRLAVLVLFLVPADAVPVAFREVIELRFDLRNRQVLVVADRQIAVGRTPLALLPLRPLRFAVFRSLLVDDPRRDLRASISVPAALVEVR